MKMHIGIMALIAGLAFSPQPAFSALDTSPKVDNIEVYQSSTSASATLQAKMEISSTTIINNYSAFQGEVYGQETVVHRSDHTVGNDTYLLNYGNDLDVNKLVDLDFDKLVNVSSGRMVVLEPERSCNYMIMKGSNQNFDHANVSTAAVMAASANLRHSMAWATSYLSGSDLRG